MCPLLCRGFLLLEACMSLLLLSILSLLIFSWHAQLITRQQKIYHTLQALCLARSAMERTLQDKPVKRSKNFRVSILRKKLLPSYTKITIKVFNNKQHLLTLTSGVHHES